ncbi:MAG: hypothetical protein JWR05_2618 [Mucilaginibacter sp.]|nr:hypothetical protein [Mucilaginibacter sp.]
MHCTFNFRPVGQGGFSTGSIKEDDRPVFEFAYDCGTLTPGAHLADQISDARNAFRMQGGKSIIDLLIISHFDEDHVNGVVELLREVRCRVLVSI